jgi:hypothetical protein
MRRVHSVRLPASTFVVCVIAFVSLAAPAFAQEAKPRPITPRGELSAEERGTIDLFQRARDSVVYINTSLRKSSRTPGHNICPVFSITSSAG